MNPKSSTHHDVLPTTSIARAKKRQISNSSHRTAHHALENVVSSLKLLDAISQEFSLPLRRNGLRGNGFDLSVGQAIDFDWGEDIFETV
jgi:hypothetical protein